MYVFITSFIRLCIRILISLQLQASVRLARVFGGMAWQHNYAKQFTQNHWEKLLTDLHCLRQRAFWRSISNFFSWLNFPCKIFSNWTSSQPFCLHGVLHNYAIPQITRWTWNKKLRNYWQKCVRFWIDEHHEKLHKKVKTLKDLSSEVRTNRFTKQRRYS